MAGRVRLDSRYVRVPTQTGNMERHFPVRGVLDFLNLCQFMPSLIEFFIAIQCKRWHLLHTKLPKLGQSSTPLRKVWEFGPDWESSENHTKYWGVLDCPNFGCFVSSGCQHFHCISMGNSIKLGMNWHKIEEIEHIPGKVSDSRQIIWIFIYF